MSFSENLQVLRKSQGISQEQLAEKLDVSRQAVSKWETDGGYPEMDKIVMLCDMFGVTMDELIKGHVELDKADIRKKYDKNYNSLAIGIAVGVFLIIFGVAVSTFFMDNFPNAPETLGTVLMLILIAAAIAIFVICSSRKSEFERANPVIPEIYTPEERTRFNAKVFPLFIAGGIALILLGVAITTALSDVGEGWIVDISSTLFLTLIAIAVGMFVYGGIMHGKYDIKNYNRDRDYEAGVRDADPPEVVAWKKKRKLRERLCGIIMLSATAIYVGIGLVAEIWSPTWAIFPVAAIICAIIAIVTDTGRRGN